MDDFFNQRLQNKVKTKAVDRYFSWSSSDMAQAYRLLYVGEVRAN